MNEWNFNNRASPAVDKRIGDLERKVKELESRLNALETVEAPRRGRPPKAVNER